MASIIDRIAAIRNRRDLDEAGQRREIYDIKVTALIDAAQALVGHTLTHKGVSFCINAISATPQPALYLDVTFSGGELAEPITHQITIVNPPVLPRERTGNERNDLRQALREMLEGLRLNGDNPYLQFYRRLHRNRNKRDICDCPQLHRSYDKQYSNWARGKWYSERHQ